MINNPRMLSAMLAVERFLDRAAVVHMNGFSFLGLKLTIAEGNAEYVGDGDDGVVLVSHGRAIKLFRMDNKGTKVSYYLNRIRKDQAYKEFKALSLLTSHEDFLEHQHFPKIVSTELDTCTAWIKPSEPNVDAWAVQMEYLAGAVPIGECARLWGLVWDEVLCFDFDRRNQNLQDIMDQLCDAVKFMGSLGIRHRDLDMCNLLVRISDFRLFILDFSRAVLPNNDERFLVTDDPTKLLVDCLNTPFYPEDISMSERVSIQYAYTESYRNPLGNHKEYDPSDPRSIGLVFDKLFKCHIDGNLNFGPGIDTVSFESENNRIRKRIESTLPSEDSEAEDSEAEKTKPAEFLRYISKDDRLRAINGLVAAFGNRIYSDGVIIKQNTRKIINSAEYVHNMSRYKLKRSQTAKV